MIKIQIKAFLIDSLTKKTFHCIIYPSERCSDGYYQCKQGIPFASKVRAESPVVAKWNEYMKDVMNMPIDERTGAQPLLEQVFYLP